ncbi:MAG: leucine-rich repeat domain-containing protein, partial [Clostridia bacterium]|nr:leucine-rich repeat domain-containing protein [Clostridia bacterium]
MKKKGLGLLMTLAGVCALVFGLTACDLGGEGGDVGTNNPSDKHDHVWTQKYIDDGDRHYQSCEGCKEVKYSEHDYSKGDCVCGKNDPKGEHKDHEWSSKFVEDGDRHYETCNGCDEKKYSEHKYDVNGYCICGKQKPEESHKHTMTEHKRIEPTCTTVGMVTYYTCSGCFLSFADKDGNTELLDATIPATGHAMSEHAEKHSTCVEVGNRAYYSCSRCKKNFEDKDGYNELSEIALPLGEHNTTLHLGEPATCTEGGTASYYTCSVCKKDYYDPDGRSELTKDEDYIVPAFGHDMYELDGNAASCISDGALEHWHCYNCEKDFADEAGTEELETTVIPAFGHKMTKKDGLAPTCTTSGYPAYYYCSNCGTNYKDEAGTETHSDPHRLTLPATGHSMTLHAQEDATCTEDGVRAYYSCLNCADKFADEDGAQRLRDNELVIRAQGHTWDDNACTACDYDGGGSRGLKWFIAAYDESLGNQPATEYGVSGIGTCTDDEIVIPATYRGLPVTKIQNRAFYQCTSFTSVEIPDSVKSIGNEAFYGCDSLESVEIPDSVTSFGESAFGYSDRLQSAKIGSGIDTIARSAFSGCVSLESVEIPDSVESIGNYAFNGC